MGIMKNRKLRKFFQKYFYLIVGTSYTIGIALVLYVTISFVASSLLAALPQPRSAILPETFNFEEYQEVEHWVGIPLEREVDVEEISSEEEREEEEE